MVDCKCGLDSCLELEKEKISQELIKYQNNPRYAALFEQMAEYQKNQGMVFGTLTSDLVPKEEYDDSSNTSSRKRLGESCQMAMPKKKCCILESSTSSPQSAYVRIIHKTVREASKLNDPASVDKSSNTSAVVSRNIAKPILTAKVNEPVVITVLKQPPPITPAKIPICGERVLRSSGKKGIEKVVRSPDHHQNVYNLNKNTPIVIEDTHLEDKHKRLPRKTNKAPQLYSSLSSELRYSESCDQNTIKIYASNMNPKRNDNLASFTGASNDLTALLSSTYEDDDTEPLNMDSISKYIRISLSRTNISQKIFAFVVLAQSEGRFSELMLKPHKDWNKLRGCTRIIYKKVYAYLINRNAIEYMFLRYGKGAPEAKIYIDLFNRESMWVTPSQEYEESPIISERIVISETFNKLLPRMLEEKFESVIVESNVPSPNIVNEGQVTNCETLIVATIKISEMIQQMKGLLFATRTSSPDFCNAAFNMSPQEFETIIREPINWVDCTLSQKQSYRELAHFITNDNYVKNFKKHGLLAVKTFRAHLAREWNLLGSDLVVKSELRERHVVEQTFIKEFNEELKKELFMHKFAVDRNYKIFLLIVYYNFMEENETAIKLAAKYTTMSVKIVKEDLLELKESKIAKLRTDENDPLANDLVNSKILLMKYISQVKPIERFKFFAYQMRQIKYRLDPIRYGDRGQKF